MSEISVQKVTTDERALPQFTAAERMLERIRGRAFELARERGFAGDRALEDWLAAERECCGGAAELAENEREYELRIALPGFEAADVSLTATPRTLYVEARMRSERRDATRGDGGTVRWSELRSADVWRRFELPAEIAVEGIRATMRHGVLRITAGKLDRPAKPVAVATAA
ncbi:MAG: Hsp20 family protein [Proteobacteria bacterium]|nr:Hsp20 family protein [Pseudomonadota bacterium]